MNVLANSRPFTHRADMKQRQHSFGVVCKYDIFFFHSYLAVWQMQRYVHQLVANCLNWLCSSGQVGLANDSTLAKIFMTAAVTPLA